MNTPIRQPRRARLVHRPVQAAVVAILAILFSLSLAGATPRGAPATAPGPIAGTSCTPSCSLHAVEGTMPQSSLPGAPVAGVPIYGYNTTNASVAAPGGPTLVVNEGDPVSITLYNDNIPSATSLMIAGQPLIPDTTGVTAGNNTTYTVVAGTLKAGTYLYEAGLTADGPRQVAMGLYGALIVRPAGAPGQAYAAASTAFNDEAALVLSEIDPAFNADPSAFDMTKFAPKYWLINGKAYPNTDPIATATGNKVLLRYVNAGLQHHSMSLLGLHQTVVAANGKPATNQSPVVAETVPAGSTLDTIVTMPSSAPTNAKYLLFEAAMHLDNSSVPSTPANPNPAYTPISFGGMMTFLTATGSTTGGGGPATSAVSLSPNPTANSVGVALSATETSSSASVSAAEYFIDTIGASGTGTAMTGAFGSSSVNVNTTITANLSNGNHTIYVHGQDSTGAWGSFGSAVLNVDTTGPSIGNMALTSSPANGTAPVQLQATASDVASGNQNVTAAEYFIDPAGTPAGGTGTAITVAAPATVVSLNATISAAAVAALAEGNHTVAVRAQDSLGNWGTFGTMTLAVDKTGPNTSGVAATPNPANGIVGVQVGTGGGFYERVDATVSDPVTSGVNSKIVAAEYFVDTVGTAGTGGVMLPADGSFSSTSEAVYAAIDLYVINQLPQGQHTICVRGKDAAGNWGACSTILFNVDKTAPSIPATGVGSIAVTPNPNPGVGNVTLTGTATDPPNNGTPANAPASNIVAGEYYIDTDPGVGAATAFTIASPASTVNFSVAINVSTLTAGNHTIGVRVKDAAGNWSVVRTTTMTVDRLFANSFPFSGSPYGWSSVGGTAGRLSLSTTALNIVDAGTRTLVASISGGTSGYVVNNLPPAPPNAANVTSYDARFYVNPHSVSIGTGTVTIFAAMSGTNRNTTVFQVQMRLNAGQYQVRAANATASASTAWINIGGTTATAIEVARSGGTLTLYVGNVSQGSVAVATTNLTAARLGLSAGVASGMSGSVYFDGFVSTRTTHVGP